MFPSYCSAYRWGTLLCPEPVNSRWQRVQGPPFVLFDLCWGWSYNLTGWWQLGFLNKLVLCKISDILIPCLFIHFCLIFFVFFYNSPPSPLSFLCSLTNSCPHMHASRSYFGSMPKRRSFLLFSFFFTMDSK